MARAKSRQTMNKMARERELKERRERKQGKKDARRHAAAEREDRSADAGSAEPGHPIDVES